METYKYAITY